MRPQFTPASVEDWRGWLEENHAAAGEVWLVFWKKGTGKPTISYNEAVEEALCFGWIDSVKKSIDDQRYAFRFTPRKPGSRWSESNVKRVKKLVAEKRMRPAGMKLVEAARKSGAFDSPAKPLTFAMPPEFGQALAADRKARTFFDSLPPSQKKQYIGWIASARRDETRQKRLQKALSMLRAGERLGMV